MLQRAHVPADGRLRHVQLARRFGKAQSARRRFEGAKRKKRRHSIGRHEISGVSQLRGWHNFKLSEHAAQIVCGNLSQALEWPHWQRPGVFMNPFGATLVLLITARDAARCAARSSSPRALATDCAAHAAHQCRNSMAIRAIKSFARTLGG
jgi:hypothetical protein